jgi:hypothetical protein
MQVTRRFTRIPLPFAAFILFVISGCNPPPTVDDGPDDVLSFEAVAMGHQGSTRDTLHLVLRTSEEWEEARQLVSPLGEVPDIDFDQYMVGLIGVPTESGGYIVEVASVEKTGDDITVHYILNVPGEDCITVQALSLPHQIVIIRKDDGNVTFERERKRYVCGLDQRR